MSEHSNSAAVGIWKGTKWEGSLALGAWSLTSSLRLWKQKQMVCSPFLGFVLFCVLVSEPLVFSQAVVYILGRRISLKPVLKGQG